MFKWRITIWILAMGLVAALIYLVVGIVDAVKSGAPVETLAALIAFGGTIVAGLIGISTKLVESEEVSQKREE